MKRILFLLSLFVSSAQAAPFLLADPYPATGVQPDSASLTVNGGAPIACTLVLTVRTSGGVSGGNTFTTPGSASSAPFSYVLRSSGASLPVVRLVP